MDLNGSSTLGMSRVSVSVTLQERSVKGDANTIPVSLADEKFYLETPEEARMLYSNIDNWLKIMPRPNGEYIMFSDKGTKSPEQLELELMQIIDREWLMDVIQ